MSKTYRLTGIFVLLLAAAVAAFHAAQPAGAEGPQRLETPVPAATLDLVIETDDGTALMPFPWFPVSPAFVRAICVDLADVFECRSTGDGTAQILDIDTGAFVAEPEAPVHAWFNLPLNLALKLCNTFDNFVCICVGVSPDLCQTNAAVPDMRLDLASKAAQEPLIRVCIAVAGRTDECPPLPRE